MPNFDEVRTVTADGRVVVPWVIQRALGLEHGGLVRFHVEGGIVTLIAAEASVVERRRTLAGTKLSPADMRAELTAELRTLLEVAERDRAIKEAAD